MGALLKYGNICYLNNCGKISGKLSITFQTHNINVYPVSLLNFSTIFLFQGGQYFLSSSLIINPLFSFLFLVDKVGKDVERHLVDIRETMINDDEDDDDDDDGIGIQGMLFFMRNS